MHVQRGPKIWHIFVRLVTSSNLDHHPIHCVCDSIMTPLTVVDELTAVKLHFVCRLEVCST